MAKKIAKVDAEAMNTLFAGEFTRLAGKADTKEEGPTPADAQCFKDHDEYLKLIETTLKADAKMGGENDPLID